MTATVGALEGAGLVSRRPNPLMPQQFLVHATDSGSSVVRRADDALRKMRPQLAGPGDSESLLRTLRDLEQHWVGRGTPARMRATR